MLSLKADTYTISYIGDKCRKSLLGDKTNVSFTADKLGAKLPLGSYERG
jgi:hypothetical protein